MSVHMFRVYIGRGKMSVSDVESNINDWVVSNAEWESDPADHSLYEMNTEIDVGGTTYHGMDVRFERSDAKDNLVQKFEDKLKNKVAWYRVGYHVCDHDGDPDPELGEGCAVNGWGDKVEWTDKDTIIPTEITDFEVA